MPIAGLCVQLLLCVCTLYRRMKPAPSLITSANHRCVSLQLGHQRCGCQQMSRVKSTQLLADIRRSRDHAESAFNTESFADNLCRVQVPSLPSPPMHAQVPRSDAANGGRKAEAKGSFLHLLCQAFLWSLCARTPARPSTHPATCWRPPPTPDTGQVLGVHHKRL